MKILIVSQYFWPENFRINDLALGLKDKGHDITILTGMPNYPAGQTYEGYTWWAKRRDNLDGIPVMRVPLFARRDSKSWQLALNYLSFVISACLLAPWMLRKQSFDMVFAVNYSPVTVGIPSILMAFLKKSPLFFWVQDLWPDSLSATGAIKSPRILSYVSLMVKKIYQHCDCILVQSKSFIEPIIVVGAEPKQIRYYPNWAETLYLPVILPSDAPERCEVPSNGFIIMFAGNLGEAQSLETIVDAAEKTKGTDIYWVFLGDGRRRIWLEKEVKDKGLEKVVVLGQRDMASMPAYFSLADAMLVTLRNDPIMATTIPGKLQSYLACGKPILAALNGAGANVVEESRAGYCVPAGDAALLAQAALKMKGLNRERIGEMEAFAQSYNREYFDRNMLIKSLETWMQDAIQGNKKP